MAPHGSWNLRGDVPSLMRLEKITPAFDRLLCRAQTTWILRQPAGHAVLQRKELAIRAIGLIVAYSAEFLMKRLLRRMIDRDLALHRQSPASQPLRGRRTGRS